MLESLKIGKKTYDLHFGFACIRELDKRHTEVFDGMTFGVGVGKTAVLLKLRNAVGILDLIQAATITEKQKPSVKDIEALFEEWHADGKTDEMFEAFLTRLVQAPLTAPVAKIYAGLVDETEAAMK